MCPRIFLRIFYMLKDTKTKTRECNYLFIIIIFYAATVQSTWGLKECKSRKYFYDFFNAGIGK
jgi:hypothetical protein